MQLANTQTSLSMLNILILLSSSLLLLLSLPPFQEDQ